MIKKISLAIWAMIFAPQIALAEDPAYDLLTQVNCSTQSQQVVTLDYILADEVRFLAGFNYSNIKVTTAIVGGTTIAANNDTLLIRRPSFGLVIQATGDHIEGTIEILDKSAFCAILNEGIFFRIQAGLDLLATVKVVTEDTQDSATPRALTLDRIGKRYFQRLQYFLGTNYEWRKEPFLKRDPNLYSDENISALDEPSSCSIYVSDPACEYQAAFKGLLDLTRFMERYGLQRSEALRDKSKFSLATMPFSVTFDEHCMRFGGTQEAAEDLKLCLFTRTGLRLATKNGFFFPPGDLE